MLRRRLAASQGSWVTINAMQRKEEVKAKDSLKAAFAFD
jgi:hypothetical protein